MSKINETLMKDPQKVWQTLKKFDYPNFITHITYFFLRPSLKIIAVRAGK